MGTRVRKTSSRLFEVFAKIERSPNTCGCPHINMMYPANFVDKEVIDCISKFTFPVGADFESPMIDHFTFVLTDIEGMFRFGFCRLAAGSQTCLCILSDHPWFEVFVKLLNTLAECLVEDGSHDVVDSLLTRLYHQDVSKPGSDISVTAADGQIFKFSCPVQDILRRIPDDRNLMEYYSAIDSYNMMVIFSSMLFERRIIVTSRRLSRMTACIHAAANLLYPFFWQQIYIPALPSHLLDFCTAPMPYLIGVHSSLLTPSIRAELDDAVVLDADCNRVTQHHNDLSLLPSKVLSLLTKQLEPKDSLGKPSALWGDAVSRAFLSAQVCLIGDYSRGVIKEGETLTFDDDSYLMSRPSKFRPAATALRSSQAFQQFIDGRLSLSNSGVTPTDVFEEALRTAIKDGTVNGKKMFKAKKISADSSRTSLFKIAGKVKGLKTFKEMLKLSSPSKGNEEIGSKSLTKTQSHAESQVILRGSDAQIDQPDTSLVSVCPTTSPSDVVFRKQYSTSNSDNSQCHKQFVLSMRPDSEEMVDSLLSPRVSLLSDPDLQFLLQKSHSFNNLCESRDGPLPSSSSGANTLDSVQVYDFNEHSSTAAASGEPSDEGNRLVDNPTSNDEPVTSRSEVSERQSDKVARIIELITSNKLVAPALRAQPSFIRDRQKLCFTRSEGGAQISRVKMMIQNIESLKSSAAPPLAASPSLPTNIHELSSAESLPVALRQKNLISSSTQRRPICRNVTILRSTAGLRPVAARRENLLRLVNPSGQSPSTKPGEPMVVVGADSGSSRRLDESSRHLDISTRNKSRTLPRDFQSSRVKEFAVETVSNESNSSGGEDDVVDKSRDVSAASNAVSDGGLSQSLDSLLNNASSFDNASSSSSSGSTEGSENPAEQEPGNDLNGGFRSEIGNARFSNASVSSRRSRTLPLSSSRNVDLCDDDY